MYRYVNLNNYCICTFLLVKQLFIKGCQFWFLLAMQYFSILIVYKMFFLILAVVKFTYISHIFEQIVVTVREVVQVQINLLNMFYC